MPILSRYRCTVFLSPDGSWDGIAYLDSFQYNQRARSDRKYYTEYTGASEKVETRHDIDC